MKTQTALKDSKINYTIKKSRRAKRMRLVVNPNGAVVVTIPHQFGEIVAERFILEKMRWISQRIALFRQFENTSVAGYTNSNYLLHKESALVIIQKKVEYYSNIHGYEFNKICIKNQKTRWGSCSRKGNLNFNFKIIFLPEHIQDYIIAHELCHLKELNHSRRFWQLVGDVLPAYKESRKKLQTYSIVV